MAKDISLQADRLGIERLGELDLYLERFWNAVRKLRTDEAKQ
jgi:hypothetical protein